MSQVVQDFLYSLKLPVTKLAYNIPSHAVTRSWNIRSSINNNNVKKTQSLNVSLCLADLLSLPFVLPFGISHCLASQVFSHAQASSYFPFQPGVVISSSDTFCSWFVGVVKKCHAHHLLGETTTSPYLANTDDWFLECWLLSSAAHTQNALTPKRLWRTWAVRFKSISNLPVQLLTQDHSWKRKRGEDKGSLWW